MIPRPGRSGGWLGAPPGGRWVERPDEPNPYLRWRELLWAHHRALTAGWSDDRFVGVVRDLDAHVAEVAGTGFRITPSGIDGALSAGVGARVWAKDETGNVSGSHKARHLFGLAIHLAVEDAPAGRPLAIASCGNAALGAATVAAAVGRPLQVFIPAWADAWVVDRLDTLGARINVCERRAGEAGDPTFLRFREAVADGAVPFGCQGTENLWTIDGGRTMGWELAAAWRDQDVTVDHLVLHVGGGALGSSTVQGLVDAVDAGVLAALPRIHAAQTEGCAPLARAHALVAGAPDPAVALAAAEADGSAFMWPWDDPHSAATGILDDVTYDWIPLVWAMLTTGGSPVVVPEPVVLEAHALAAGSASRPPTPTGSAGVAGALALAHDGALAADETVAVLLTG